MRENVPILRYAIPTYQQSAAADTSMNKPLKGKKLKKIEDMYRSYVAEDRWPTQLFSELSAVNNGVDGNHDMNLALPRNSQYDEQAIRVGDLLETEDGAARAYSYLTRTDGGNNSDEDDAVVAQKLISKPDLGIPRT